MKSKTAIDFMESSDITRKLYYPSGLLQGCGFSNRQRVKTKSGILVPKYEIESSRDKNRSSITFYESGEINSVYLQEQTPVITPIGQKKVELISFYEDGSVKRVFPRYGQMSGFWSQEEECSLIERDDCVVAENVISAKISCFYFYPSGKIKSLTFAPGEKVNIKVAGQKIRIRNGISFYESGAVKSVEPDEMAEIITPIGTVLAYDNLAIGISADRNSLVFFENQKVSKLKTIWSGMEIEDVTKKQTFFPEKRRSQMDYEKFELVPLELGFEENSISIVTSRGKKELFSLDCVKINLVSALIGMPQEECSGSCSDCSSCGIA